MFQITVKSFWKAMASIKAKEFDRCISIISPTETRMDQYHPNHYIYQFDDIEWEVLTYKGIDYVGPTFSQIESLLELTQSFEEDNSILVHCTAGKSRSSACAIGIYVQAGLEPEDALQRVIRSREKEGNGLVIPNRRIIGFLDDLLQQEGKLKEAIAEHYDVLRKTMPEELISRNRHQIED